jgi:lipopolysaccharide biosynthesis glycosyltransferase
VRRCVKQPPADQCAINAVAWEVSLCLAKKWNCMTFEQTLVEPNVLHFAGPTKPWIHTKALGKAIYDHFASQTPFTERRSFARKSLNAIKSSYQTLSAHRRILMYRAWIKKYEKFFEEYKQHKIKTKFFSEIYHRIAMS